MPDKDDFTFDDGDDFPETDLSSAFSDGEHSVPDVDYEQQEPPARGGGGSGSRTKALLMILLVVVAIAAGAFYFMDLGGTTPTAPTVPAVTTKAVTSPQTTEQAPPAPAVAVAVPVPPAPQAGDPVEKPVEASAVSPAGDAAITVTAAVPEPPAVAADTKPGDSMAAPVEAKAKVEPASAVTGVEAKAPMNVAMVGPFTLDAGSYLMTGNRDTLVKKLQKLGYEPLVTPIKATIDMTRLRLGTYPPGEVEAALAFARTIEPAAFSVPAGDQFVVYAGTFLKSANIEGLTSRFLKEGIRVKAEPVEVERTLSRIRFGSFASRSEAEEAAREVAGAGVKAVVVKGR